MSSLTFQVAQNKAIDRQNPASAPIRTLVIQSAIPAYNVPVFENMALFDGVDLTVWANLKAPSHMNQYERDVDRFAAVHLPAQQVAGFTTRPGLLKRLFAEKPDIVIFDGDPRDISEAAAMALARLMGCGIAVWNMFHEIGPPSWWAELYMKYVGYISHLVLCYGERGRKEQLKRGTPPEKIQVISTAIDEQSILKIRDRLTRDEIDAFVAEQGLKGKYVLLHVVRLTEVKRPDLMLNYYSRLLGSRNDVELVWIGGGPLEARIKDRAVELGIAKKMRFVGALYDEHTLALWYAVAAVFVTATCVGLSIHEAMCFGVPVITDDNALTQTSEFEVLQSGVNGLTFKAGDADDFVEKVNSILNDKLLRQKLSVGARKRLEVEYTLARKMDNLAAAVDILKSKIRHGSQRSASTLGAPVSGN
jgi:glycosyltransferase involved in cell wall biosynthesis